MDKELIKWPSFPEGPVTVREWRKMGITAKNLKNNFLSGYHQYIGRWYNAVVTDIEHGKKEEIAKAIFGEDLANVRNVASIVKKFDREEITVPESLPFYVMRELAPASPEKKAEVLKRISQDGQLPSRDSLRAEVKAETSQYQHTSPKRESPFDILKRLLSEPSLQKLACAVESDPVGFMIWTDKFTAKPSQFEKPPQDVSTSMLVQDAQKHVQELQFEEEKEENPFEEEEQVMRNLIYEKYAEFGGRTGALRWLKENGYPELTQFTMERLHSEEIGARRERERLARRK